MANNGAANPWGNMSYPDRVRTILNASPDREVRITSRELGEKIHSPNAGVTLINMQEAGEIEISYGNRGGRRVIVGVIKKKIKGTDRMLDTAAEAMKKVIAKPEHVDIPPISDELLVPVKEYADKHLILLNSLEQLKAAGVPDELITQVAESLPKNAFAEIALTLSKSYETISTQMASVIRQRDEMAVDMHTAIKQKEYWKSKMTTAQIEEFTKSEPKK